MLMLALFIFCLQEIFFELRERLAEFKLEEEDLNVSKIYAVFGKRQDRATFEEARVKHVRLQN